MNNLEIIKEFQLMIDEVAPGKTVSLLFTDLKRENASRIELMIVDSAIKGMNLRNLYKTLLLSEDSYIKLIQNLTLIMINMFQKSHPPLKTILR